MGKITVQKDTLEDRIHCDFIQSVGLGEIAEASLLPSVLSNNKHIRNLQIFNLPAGSPCSAITINPQHAELEVYSNHSSFSV